MGASTVYDIYTNTYNSFVRALHISLKSDIIFSSVLSPATADFLLSQHHLLWRWQSGVLRRIPTAFFDCASSTLVSLWFFHIQAAFFFKVASPTHGMKDMFAYLQFFFYPNRFLQRNHNALHDGFVRMLVFLVVPLAGTRAVFWCICVEFTAFIAFRGGRAGIVFVAEASRSLEATGNGYSLETSRTFYRRIMWIYVMHHDRNSVKL